MKKIAMNILRKIGRTLKDKHDPVSEFIFDKCFDLFMALNKGEESCQ